MDVRRISPFFIIHNHFIHLGDGLSSRKLGFKILSPTHSWLANLYCDLTMYRFDIRTERQRDGSAGWASSHKAKVHWFNSQSCLGCGFGPWSGCMKQLIDVSLPFFLPSLPFFLSCSINNNNKWTKKCPQNDSLSLSECYYIHWHFPIWFHWERGSLLSIYASPSLSTVSANSMPDHNIRSWRVIMQYLLCSGIVLGFLHL